MEEFFSIKDLENLTGIKAHTIRVWEQRYSFLKPNRTDTNIRHYSGEELKAILNIALLNKNGFKISYIDKMGEEEMKAKVLLLQSSEAQAERTVNSLIQNMVDMDALKFEEVMDTCIQKNGISSALHQIIFPFLARIGLLWQTNNIIPAQEHVVSNIIRQKIIAAIDKIKSTVSNKKTILLFLPEAEHHELALLFVHFLLKQNGLNVIYLGINLPLKDFTYIVNNARCDLAYTHLTAISSQQQFDKFLAQYNQLSEKLPLVISGYVTQLYKKKLPANVSFKLSFQQVQNFIENL